MKKLWIFALCLLALQNAVAQDQVEERADAQDELKTLFSGDTRVTGFGAFDMSFTSIKDHYGLLLGGHGGLIINDKILLGLGGYGIATPVRFDGTDPARKLELRGGWGGLYTGIILSPMEAFHISFPLFAGVGGMNVVDPSFTWDPGAPLVNDVIENTVLIVVEPGAQMEVNITRFFRMGLGMSYRFTEGISLPRNGVEDGDFRGLSGNLSFKFGGF